MRLWAVVSLGVCLAEVLISAAAHLAYGLYLFSIAVTFDIVEILNNHRLKRFRVWQAVADSYSKPNIVVSERSRDIGNGSCFEGYERAPIVLVHGIFGFGKGKLGVVSYWAGAEKKDDCVLVPDLGSLTSVYDRARELFYYLKGGTIDYGEEHSAQYGHARFGKSYEQGHYPEWDENHPVHFVGHSCGVQVVRVLHNMLAEKKFLGHDNSSEGWVLSVTSLSGALNGTTRVYLDGLRLPNFIYPSWDNNKCCIGWIYNAGSEAVHCCRAINAVQAGIYTIGFEAYRSNSVYPSLCNIYYSAAGPEDGRTIKPISLLQLCRVGVIIYDWLDIGWLKTYYNFGFDHFNITWRNVGISGLVDSLLGNVGPFASEDWILVDLSLQVSAEVNTKLQTFPNTYYFSYATRKTRKLFGVTIPSSLFGIHPLLFIRTLQMSQWCYPSNVPLPCKGYNDEDWQDNDGALNTISMLYPRFPEPHTHCWLSPELKDGHSFQPGVWYYTIVEADHILFVINRARAGVQFDILYDNIFQRCRKQMSRVISAVPCVDQAMDHTCSNVENCTCHSSRFDQIE